MAINMRSGTILIIVAALCALLASLTMAFLLRMRTDAEEMQGLVRETQARIMLYAACNYLQEASRMGWSSSSNADGETNTETFGWIDVRDNRLGPKFIADGRDNDSRFPVGSAKRFDMWICKRPPYALQMTSSYNPILTPYSTPSVPESDSRFGMPYLSNPDPQPAGDTNNYLLANPDGSTVNDSKFNLWAAGDESPRGNSQELSWFRIYRESGATFLITCGAGGSKGYRKWNEMNADEQAVFHEAALFNEIRSAETLFWYRVEWSAASTDNNVHLFSRDAGDGYDHYLLYSENAFQNIAVGDYRSHPHGRSLGGTFRWIQRLRNEPTHW